MGSGVRFQKYMCRLYQYLFIAFLCFTSAYAEGETPAVSASMPGIVSLSAEDLIELAQTDIRLIVIDLRLPQDRSSGYIDQSISLPLQDIRCASLTRIQPDPRQALVFYDNGINAAVSPLALERALACGYQQLYWFKGGFQEWLIKDFPYLLE